MSVTEDQYRQMLANRDKGKKVFKDSGFSSPNEKKKSGRTPHEKVLQEIYSDSNNAVCIEYFGKLPKYVFNMPPFTAPRMSRSDRWKTDPNHPDPKKRQRICATRYWSAKNEFKVLCRLFGYELQPTLNIAFFIEMPESWSEKRKLEMNHKPHQQKPDFDNLTKAVNDSFDIDDSFVFGGTIYKFWSDKPMIVIF